MCVAQKTLFQECRDCKVNMFSASFGLRHTMGDYHPADNRHKYSQAQEMTFSANLNPECNLICSVSIRGDKKLILILNLAVCISDLLGPVST